jgi:hypothetical protein
VNKDEAAFMLECILNERITIRGKFAREEYGTVESRMAGLNRYVMLAVLEEKIRATDAS